MKGRLSFRSSEAKEQPICRNRDEEKFPIRVKELSKRNRSHLLHHLLGLSKEDRLLRFGAMLSDELIFKYVQAINFSYDKIFGVYDGRCTLLAAGHLAFAPRDAVPALSEVTEKERIAELGVSVSASARGCGIGTKLFKRAAIHCRNADVDTLTVHCLFSNRKMMHIAHKAGMDIHRAYDEADAYLKLPPADPSSMMQEALQEQAAALDYAFKSRIRACSRLLGRLFGTEKK